MMEEQVLNPAKIERLSRPLEEYIKWMQEALEQVIEPNDNFLDAGGHSMIAISLNARMKKEFGLTLSMECLFNKTLKEVFSEANNNH